MTKRLAIAALTACLASRVLFFALVIIGSQISFVGKEGAVWQTRIELSSERVLPELMRVVMTGDAWWYRSIALNGYGPRADAGGFPNYAFFPLYPLAVRGFAISGEFPLDGMLFSNLAFVVAALLLAAVARRSALSEDDAMRAVWLLAYFPTSYFFSMPLTESLFLALSLGSILSAQYGRWLLAGVTGAAAALTRLPGLLLVVPLALLFVQANTRPRIRALWLLLVPAGTAAFMAYLYRLTGDPLAFTHVQKNWNREVGGFWEPLVAFVMKPHVIGEPWNFIGLHFLIAVLLFACAVHLLIKREWAFGAYALVSVLLPLSTGSLQSLGRYALVVFPLHLWMSRNPAMERLVLAICITLYGWLIALLILRVDFSLA